MYDMYRWDQSEHAANGGGRTVTAGRAQPAGAGVARPGGPAAANGAAHPAGGPASGAQAVQVALDLRDNGGDSGAARDQ